MQENTMLSMPLRWLDNLKKPQVNVKCLKQGWGVLHIGQAIDGGPLRAGGKMFENGYGTHADSRIRIECSDGIRRLKITGGPGEDDYTLARREYVPAMVFSIQADGKTLATTRELKLGEAELLDVDCGGVREVELLVHSPMGIGHAHAIWGNPEIETAKGDVIVAIVDVEGAFPVSFKCGEMASGDFLHTHGLHCDQRDCDDHILYSFTAESDTLRMIMDCKAYKDYPVLEWHLAFENPSSNTRSPRLANVCSLDYPVNEYKGLFRLERVTGSFCEHPVEKFANVADDFRDSFISVETLIVPELLAAESAIRSEVAHIAQKVSFGTENGRSSENWLPFFDVLKNGECTRFALGWSGSWRAEVESSRLSAGIALFDAVLEPGERFEFPSVVMMSLETSDRDELVNIWRRFAIEKIMQPFHGAPPKPPLTSMTWGGMPEKAYLNKIELLKQHKIPYDVLWVDAGWFAKESLNEFEPTWSENVGDWNFDPISLPREFQTVSEAARKEGKGFLLWFEPERIRSTSRLAKEHPEYLIDIGAEDLLYNLGDPVAWQACFDKLAGIIERNHLAWLRIDFNFNPAPYWKSLDSNGRQGVTEVKYISGLYRFWREMRRRFPDMMIDDCSSGGRRLDFELLRYSMPLWYSDMYCSPTFNPKYALTHQAGMASWWPLYGGGVQNQEGGDTYRFRACMGPALGFHFFYSREFLERKDYPYEWLKQRLEEYISIRDCFAGDFHCLAQPRFDDSSIAAFQYDLPEEQRGIITVFKGEDCPEVERCLQPKGLIPTATYLVEDIDGAFSPFEATGRTLLDKGFIVRIETRRTARIVTYRIKD